MIAIATECKKDGVLYCALPRTQRDTLRVVDTYQAPPSQPPELDKYVYCEANPVNRVDPSGNMSLMELGISIGAIALVVGVTVVGLHYYHLPTTSGGTRLTVTAAGLGGYITGVSSNVDAGSSADLNGLVNTIAKEQGKKPISDLVIIAHGEAGLIQLDTNENPPVIRGPIPGDPRIIYDTGNGSTHIIQLPSTARLLGQQLKARLNFAPGAHIILNICNSGTSLGTIVKPGELPQAIADGSGVTVYAPNQEVGADACLYPANELASLPGLFTAYNPSASTTQSSH